MKITVLQGLNMEYPTTTLKIELASPIPTEILDEIKNIHPVFMDDYSIDRNIITIHSKFASLWREIGKALINFSNKDWTEDYTRKYIFDVAIYKKLLSFSSVVILWEAMQQGLEITPLYFDDQILEGEKLGKFNRYYVIGSGKESAIINTFASSKDSYIAHQTQKDKWTTNLIVERLKLPIAKWQLIASHEDIKDIWDTYTKPVVIKRTIGARGIGVCTNIDTLEKAYKAFDINQKITDSKPREENAKKIMMQEQVVGEDYRLLIIDGKFAIATKRIPAFVVGDGKLSIKQLVEEANKDPRRDIKNPIHTLKPMIIDDQMTNFLKDQGLDFDFVPKNNEKIFVRKVASVSQGGVTEDVTDIIHPQIKCVAESLAQSIHAYVLGVDILCKDITKPLTRDNGIIIECNTKPEGYLNAFPVTGKQYPEIAKVFFNGLIGPVMTKRIVIVGGTTKEALTYSKTIVDASQRVGMYSDGKTYIDGDVVNEAVETMEAMAALKINKSLDVIIFHFSKVEEAKEFGFGFERIDLMVINKKVSEEVEKVANGYLTLGLISSIKEF